MTPNRMLALLLAAGCGSASSLPEQRERELSTANPQVFEVDSSPYGTTMQEWAYNWLRWLYSVPLATNPNIVAGADFNQNQAGPVFFVPDGPGRAITFSVPRHKALGLMLSQIANDFPCPDPNFKPAPGQSLFDFLSEGLTVINDNIAVLDVRLDGVAIHDALRYRLTSTALFTFTGDPSLADGFDSCVTGSPQPAVADDLFLILKPLPPGRHVLVTHIENRDGNVFDRTRTITVE